MLWQTDLGIKHAYPFRVLYLDGAQLSRCLSDDRVMAVIRFVAQGQEDGDDPRLLTVGLPELGGGNTIEVWHSQAPLQMGISEGIRYQRNDEVLFAHLRVNEANHPNLDAAVFAAYRRMLAFIRAQGYPFLLRVWNYFPDINRPDGEGLERYRAFCQGRYRVLREELWNFRGMLPAACALGTRTAGLLLYCLAAKQSGVQIENPRQVSAFDYPSLYGPKSPSFSRSTLKTWGRRLRHLYISGTASIVGHVTRHAGNLYAQLQETLANLDALLNNAANCAQSPFDMVLLKVYVRHADDVESLRDLIARRFGHAVAMVFLQADICRSDLLIEIEGLAVVATDHEPRLAVQSSAVDQQPQMAPIKNLG